MAEDVGAEDFGQRGLWGLGSIGKIVVVKDLGSRGEADA